MYISVYEDKLLFLDELPFFIDRSIVTTVSYYSPFFTSEDVFRYECAFAGRRKYLLQRLSTKSVNLRTDILYTPMIDDFRRRKPSSDIRLLDKNLTTIYEMTELLVIMQHTELLFQLIEREFDGSSSSSVLWLVIEYVLSHSLPFSHIAMIDRLKLLLQDIDDWCDKIDRLFELIDECDHSVSVLDIAESLIFELMHDNRIALAETFNHCHFYRSVYKRASRSLRYVLQHDFGQPIASKYISLISPSRFEHDRSTVINLSTLSFETLYRYYEGRLLLRRYNLQLQYTVKDYSAQLYNYNVAIYSPTVSRITISEQYDLPRRCFPVSPIKFIYLCPTPDRFYIETALPVVAEDLI